MEVNRVMFYLEELLNVGVNGIQFVETDVGIISPYKKQVRHDETIVVFCITIILDILFQCTYIEEACRKKGWRDIMIASVEQFQGKEKKIIIVSTVRSKSDNIGFLNNFRVKNFSPN